MPTAAIRSPAPRSSSRRASTTLAENIIHLVLAKIAGAPDNVKGISLFVVPKFLVNEDGSLGERNAVSCGAIEKKMGIHGNATCVMNYDGANGWLVGEPEKGLAAMFIMMNAARLGVGLQGLAQGEVAYQNAVAYAQRPPPGPGAQARRARARRQGRSDHRPSRRSPDADGIAGVERGGPRARAVGRAAGRPRPPVARRGGAAAGRRSARPAHPGDQGLSHRQGLRGRGRRPAGARRPRLYPRDGAWSSSSATPGSPRSTKAPTASRRWTWSAASCRKDGGRAVRAFFELVGEDIAEAKAAGDPAGVAAALEPALGDLQAATMWLAQNGMADPNNAGAGAYAYMDLMGLVVAGLDVAQDGPRRSRRDRRRLGRRRIPRRQARHRALLREPRAAHVERLTAQDRGWRGEPDEDPGGGVLGERFRRDAGRALIMFRV